MGRTGASMTRIWSAAVPMRYPASTKMRKEPGPRLAFDEGYYRRFYLDPSTRIDDAAHHGKLVEGVVSMIEYFGLTLRRVLDVGAGIGRWGKWLKKHRPTVEVVSTEMDEAVCRRYGHVQADISRFRLHRKFDLVVCQGVLPYLDDDACARAIENLAAMNGGFLYLEAITRRDVEEVCDRELTDLRIHKRTGGWYSKRLAPHYVKVGCGLFYKRRGPLQFYELEAGE